MVPCILVTFEKGQIVVWRGKDYKPVEDGCFLPDRESFDDMDGSSSDGSLVCGEEGCDSVGWHQGPTGLLLWWWWGVVPLAPIGCCSLLLCLYSPFFEDQVQAKAIGTCRIILKRVLWCTHYSPVDLIMEVKKSRDIYFVTHFVITYTCVKWWLDYFSSSTNSSPMCKWCNSITSW